MVERRATTLVLGLPVELSDHLAADLATALGVEWRAQESSFFGGDYYRSGGGIGEELYLFNNLDPLDEEPYYGSFAEYPAILRLDQPARSSGELIRVLTAVLRKSPAVLEELPGGQG